MPLLESQPDAVANLYAQSLFDIVVKGGEPAVQSTLDELEAVMDVARSDKQFNEFLASRIISPDQRSQSLDTMFKGKLSEHTVRFLQVLNGNSRMHVLPAVVAAFDSITHKKFGRIEVDVYTATPLSDSDKAALESQLQAKLGRAPVIHAYTDPSMLGGIRFQIGDKLIDASLGARLAKIREQISTNGLPGVRAAADRIFAADPSRNGH
ncbi:MAG: ATP synthase F1 subunit delta [Phycisphaerales bacterium]